MREMYAQLYAQLYAQHRFVAFRSPGNRPGERSLWNAVVMMLQSSCKGAAGQYGRGAGVCWEYVWKCL